ncbi:MAG: hypothetical protein QOG48_1105 [Verrucomicrobiota bacterium]|jgi:hypothetical protein
MIKKIALGYSLLALASAISFGASDNFENSNPSNDYNDGIQYNDNGGSGFGALTYLEGTGGSLFDGSLSGARALGIAAGNGPGNTQALGRTVTGGVIAGTYSLDLRFNVNNVVGTTGFNIKSALGTSFGGNENLFVGLTPGSGNNVLFVDDATGTHTFSIGTLTELRGVNINFSLTFDTAAGTYSLTASASSQLGSISGSLKDTNGATAGVGTLNAIAFGNFNTGDTQDLVVDNLNITAVPEPSTLSFLAAPALLGAVFFIRRRRA